MLRKSLVVSGCCAALFVLSAAAEPAPEFLFDWGSLGSSPGEFVAPKGITFSMTEDAVYVVDTGNNRIQKFQEDGTFVLEWGAHGTGFGEFDNVLDIAVDGQGFVYVVDDCSSGIECSPRIQKFTSDGVFVLMWGTLGVGDGEFRNPIGIATDGAGNVYVADQNSHEVQKFTGDGTFLVRWGEQGPAPGQFQFPWDVTVDLQGNIYVCDASNYRVQKFNPGPLPNSVPTFEREWGELGSAPGEFNIPIGIATTPTGDVYVADVNNKRVQKFTPLGDLLTVWGSEGTGEGEFQAPWDVAVRDDGLIYVTDSHRVQVFEPAVGIVDTASISGLLFNDLNGNGARDFGEDGLPNRVIRLEPVDHLALTGATGAYKLRSLPAGSYSLSLVPSSGWATTSPMSGEHVLNLLDGEHATDIDFGESPDDRFKDLSIDLIASFPGPLRAPCCDEELAYRITYRNVGTLPTGTRVELLLPPEVNYVSSVAGSPQDFMNDDPLVSSNGKKLAWTFVNPIQPNVVGSIWVTGVVKCSGNSTPTFVAHAKINTPVRNAHLPLKVACSFDPNDKQVIPAGCGVAGLISRTDSLTYRVRFQNTGTGPAFLVVIRDTLDDDLDPATVEPIATSHAAVLEIDGQALAWNFWGIVLPDSASDELGSQGYVKFKARPRSSAVNGAVIENRASIYFDLNEPVLTNSTINTITEDPLPVASFTASEDVITDGGTVSFTYTGGTVGASYLWVFGAGADPESSTVENPTDVQFSGPGFYSVLQFVTLGVCQSEPAVHLVTVQDPLDVSAVSSAEIYLEPVRPNPSAGSLSIGFALPQEAMVRLSVWDLQGRKVAQLANRSFGAGRHNLTWNGAIGGGKASAGMYFVRYRALGRTVSRRVVMLR